jgi:predicted ATPase
MNVALPPPVPPDDLVDACTAGQCLVHAGPGLSVFAGYPTWPAFATMLCDALQSDSSVDPAVVDSLRGAVEEGEVDTALDTIANMIGVERASSYVASIFGASRPLGPVHEALGAVPFAAAVTSNYDDLLERAFAARTPHVYTSSDAEQLYTALGKREIFLLKLYGTSDRPETTKISFAQYEQESSRNQHFREFMSTLLLSRMLLFLGAEIESIERHLKLYSATITAPRRHYALAPIGGSSWVLRARLLQQKYGVEVIPYDGSEDWLVAFLDELALRTGAVSTSPAAIADGPAPQTIQRVTLDNIGPFEHLELELDPRWNILLGDNGVGKSSILKAIAVGLAGKDAQPFANALVRYGATSASIVLETADKKVYTTELFRRGDEVEVAPGSVRALDSEGWLALGFPALRTVSWERPKAPEAQVKGRPSPEDLLPLVRGGADPRLDKLKQWIVNLDYWIKDAQSRGEDGSHYRRLLDDFFTVVGDLAVGLKVGFKEVRPQTNEVVLVTDDGELPLEAVSQGTISLIGWVGILLQRLYEVYGDETEPRKRHALVLMDELDAHMHPIWQQTLVPSLATAFPRVQFVGTTHSPLVVGGMRETQVFRFIRDDARRVVRVAVDPHMLYGRADQLLTGELFGMHSTLDVETQRELERYTELLGRRKRTKREEAEFQRLRERLETRIPPSHERPEERAEYTRLMDQLRDALKQAAASGNFDLA